MKNRRVNNVRALIMLMLLLILLLVSSFVVLINVGKIGELMKQETCREKKNRHL